MNTYWNYEITLTATPLKLKAAPATATVTASTKAKAASKKVSLKELIELSAQTARAAATLSKDPLAGEKREARCFWKKVEFGSSREEWSAQTLHPRPHHQHS